jgi:phage-related protein
VAEERELIWVGSSLEDLRRFPEEVKDVMGYALYLAQRGEKHTDAKPLRDFGGAGILEIVERHHTDAFRAVYIIRLSTAVFVLHAFQKKAKQGVATPPRDLELIRRRLAEAEEVDTERTQRTGEHER